MAISPLLQSSDPISLSIEVDGKTIPETILIKGIEVNRQVNNIANAQVVAFINQNFDDSSAVKHLADAFQLESTIKIKAGYANANEQIFEGIITRQELKIKEGSTIELLIHGVDKAARMNKTAKSRLFQNRSKDKLFSKILEPYALPLKIDSHPDFTYLVQEKMTDWAFIKACATANNYLLYTEDGTLVIKKPKPKQVPLLTLTYGLDVEQFEGYLNHSETQETPTVKGKIKFQGNASPQINTTIELKNFGLQLDGNALVSQVVHEIKKGEWKTTLGLGGDIPTEDLVIKATNIDSYEGLRIAKVKQITDDPEGQYRVLVSLEDGFQKNIELWAKMAQNYATNGAGTFFYPEIEDEVILCFPNGKLDTATILGQFYSNLKKPVYTPDEGNRFKAIVSRAGLTFEMNEQEKTVQLSTPEGQQVLLSDKGKMIRLKDSNGNALELSANGITLDSTKDIILKAKGDILLSAHAAIEAKAKADLYLEALNVKAQAKVGLEASGNASAKLSAAGQLTIQGAMVMIN